MEEIDRIERLTLFRDYLVLLRMAIESDLEEDDRREEAMPWIKVCIGEVESDIMYAEIDSDDWCRFEPGEVPDLRENAMVVAE